MERGVGKPPFFDGTNFAYWKVRMCAYLQGLDSKIWEICENEDYVVLGARITELQVTQHASNARARSILFSSLSLPEFERVSSLTTAREIWQTLVRYHEGNPQIKSRLFDTYRREYENFAQLAGKSVDGMFTRFQSIVNKMRANRANLPYDDHEMAIKLLHALDRKVWEMKVAAI